jgi:ferredoxin
MADPAQKVPENVSGAFYVDASCIDCELCRELAPAHFERQDDAGYSFVARQPQSPEQVETCHSALEQCPVEAIGQDEDETLG